MDALYGVAVDGGGLREFGLELFSASASARSPHIEESSVGLCGNVYEGN